MVEEVQYRVKTGEREVEESQIASGEQEEMRWEETAVGRKVKMKRRRRERWDKWET